MAMFDLSQYETVEERIARFYKDHADGRIITKNLTSEQDRAAKTWVVQAEIYLPIWDLGAALEDAKIEYKKGYERDCWFLKATGLAFEIDGNGMANKTSALENAETSAIGRALANAGYSGNKRASREEMQKVERATVDYLAQAMNTTDIDKLRDIYKTARADWANDDVLKKIEARVNELKQATSK